jgi:chromosome segregation ATPase
MLEVRINHGADPSPEVTEIAPDPPPEDEAEDETEPEHAAENGRPAAIGAQVELLAAQEEVRAVRASLQQTEAELARAREDLEAERTRSATDSERFREGLAQVRETAEQALSDEHRTVIRLDSELRDAKEAAEAKDAELDALGEQLVAADEARTQAEGTAQSEIDALREQVAKLERDGRETERLRASIEQARADAERLLQRLSAIRAK